jgi:hypothetical protein
VSKKTNRDLYAKIDALYRQLPTVACRGLCGVCCGPIPLTMVEADRLRRSHPTRLAPAVVNENRCVYLTPTSRCSVYDVRPLICRCFGLLKRMSCPWGCVPSSWLTDHAFGRLSQQLEQIAGTLMVTTVDGLQPHGGSFLDLNLHAVTPEYAEHYADLTRTARALHHGRITAVLPGGPGGFVDQDKDDDEN